MNADKAREIAHEIARPIIEYIVKTCHAVNEGRQDEVSVMLTADSIAEQISEFIDPEKALTLANCVVGELESITPQLGYAMKVPEAYITIFAGHIMYHIIKHDCKEREVTTSE